MGNGSVQVVDRRGSKLYKIDKGILAGCPSCGSDDLDRMTTAWICNKCGYEIPDTVLGLVKREQAK